MGAPAWPHGEAPRPTTGCKLSPATTKRPGQARARPGWLRECGRAVRSAPGEGQSANWKRFVHAAVKRYGDRVKDWGFWNEPTERHFWPEWPDSN